MILSGIRGMAAYAYPAMVLEYGSAVSRCDGGREGKHVLYKTA